VPEPIFSRRDGAPTVNESLDFIWPDQ